MTRLLAFVVVFGALVFFHELGHFLLAKLAGVKVHEFALGFGPPLFKMRRGETQYAVRVIPLGGYVKMAGMDRPENEEDEVDEDDERNFNNKSILSRMAIIAAGPVMNFVLAALLLGILAGTYPARPQIVEVLPDTPAAQAGLQPGDQILSVDGRETVYDYDVHRAVQENEGEPIFLKVSRGDETLQVRVTPTRDEESNQAMIGIQYVARQPAPKALVSGLTRVWAVTKGIVTGLVLMVAGEIQADVAGPIGIYNLIGQTAQQGVVNLLGLAAFLSVNLGLLNLLPVPVLDGGWLAILLVEGIRGKPLKPEHKGFAQFIGLALLLMLLLFATYKDLAKMLGG